MVDQERMADALARIAQTLITDYGIADVLYPLMPEISDLLGLTGAGVLLKAEGEDVLRVAAASDDTLTRIDTLQAELDEGPSLTAYQEGRPVTVPDLTADDRFPRFSPRAHQAGLRSVHAFPMQVHGRCVGALCLYDDDVCHLGEEQRDAARTLAAAATAYILNCRALDEATSLAAQLQHALDSRVIVEQAKGMLSERLQVSPQEAFDMLRRHCRSHGMRLAQAATQVVEGSLVLGGDR